MIEVIKNFFQTPPNEAGAIYNERSLQLEIGYFLRCKGFNVEFERPFKARRPLGSTKSPKTNLDLLVIDQNENVAMELKVPLNKRHPETFYDYCADLEFVEALVRTGKVNRGFCLMMTNDHVFWQDSGRGSKIHDCFRRHGEILTGKVTKPTGAQDSAVVLTGRYALADEWCNLNCPRLMSDAQYLLIEVHP